MGVGPWKTALNVKFDWYAATLPEKPMAAAESIAGALGGVLEASRGMYGYTNGFQVQTEEGTVARILCGGVNPWPNAWASGEHTEKFVGAIRQLWPGNHNVSRMDSCEDILGEPDTWDKLYSVAVELALERGLATRLDGDYVRKISGRTLYVGSPKSPCSIRMYEKGRQMQKLNPATAHEYPDNWIRLEAQIRPDKEIRDTAATCSPSEAWGYSKSTVEFAQRCLGVSVPWINGHRNKKSEDQRALEFMCRQYKNMLERFRLKNPDGWDGVGQLIHKTIRNIERQDFSLPLN